MNMEIHIAPSAGFVSVDGVGYDKLDLASLPFADARMVIWDGRDGTILRKSAVPGKFDVSHFADPAPLEPFVALWQVEHTSRLEAAEEQRKVNEQINADIKAQDEAQAARTKENAALREQIMPQDGIQAGGGS